MGLLSNLGLKARSSSSTPAPSADKADIAKAESLKAQLGKDIKDAVQLANSLPDPKAKAELALALKAVDAERKKAEAIDDATKRAQALEAARGKVTAATTAAAQPATAAQGVDNKAEATRLAPAIARQQADAKAAYDKLRPEQARLEDAIDRALADKSRQAEVADLQAKKKAIDVQIAPIEGQLKQLDADAKALGDPRSTSKTYNDILARQKSGALVVPQVTIDKHDSELEKKLTEKKMTTVKTGYEDGQSKTQTDVSKTSVGKDGVTQDNSRVKEVVKSDGTKTTDTDKRVSTVGLDGVSHDKSVKSETENKDGKKSGTEDKTSVKVGPGGATRTDTQVKTNEDGSSSTQTKTAGVERGDGKAGVVRSNTDSKTDASGNTTTTSTKTKGGVIAGKDGIGAYADSETGYDRKNANGMKTGAVAGLNANVVCNVTAKGGEPPTCRCRSTSA